MKKVNWKLLAERGRKGKGIVIKIATTKELICKAK